MKNQVIYIDNVPKMQAIIRKALSNNVKVVELDGNNIKTWEDYALAAKLAFGDDLVREEYWDFAWDKNNNTVWDKKYHINPNEEYREMVNKYQISLSHDMRYLGYEPHPDYGTDRWVGNGRYMLVIYNYSNFLKSDEYIKKKIVDDFNSDVLPWWDEMLSRLRKYDNEGQFDDVINLFNIYLVD